MQWIQTLPDHALSSSPYLKDAGNKKCTKLLKHYSHKIKGMA